MKIHPHTPKQPTPASQGADRPRLNEGVRGDRPASTTSREPAPTIATTRVYEQALQAIRNTPVVDIERVETVRTQLTEGQYRIDDLRTAEGLIEHERALQG